MAMALGEQELRTIGDYVKTRLPEWLGSMNYYPRPDKYDLEIRDRMVRVEEELKNQRELMLRGFEQVDKRFEQVDKRFEQVDKRLETFERRFERLDTKFNRLFALGISGITVLAALLSLYQFLD